VIGNEHLVMRSLREVLRCAGSAKNRIGKRYPPIGPTQFDRRGWSAHGFRI